MEEGGVYEEGGDVCVRGVRKLKVGAKEPTANFRLKSNEFQPSSSSNVCPSHPKIILNKKKNVKRRGIGDQYRVETRFSLFSRGKLLRSGNVK